MGKKLDKTGFKTCFTETTKNRFKTGWNSTTRELQKNPDIYKFFPIQWCRFQSIFGAKNFFSIFFKKKRFEKKEVSNLFFFKLILTSKNLSKLRNNALIVFLSKFCVKKHVLTPKMDKKMYLKNLSTFKNGAKSPPRMSACTHLPSLWSLDVWACLEGARGYNCYSLNILEPSSYLFLSTQSDYSALNSNLGSAPLLRVVGY